MDVCRLLERHPIHNIIFILKFYRFRGLREGEKRGSQRQQYRLQKI